MQYDSIKILLALHRKRQKMKLIALIFTMTLFMCVNTFSQKLTLTDLTNLCNKKDWEDINQTLLAKNWTYYNSEKGNTYKYNTITWSFNKEEYNDKAQGWVYLYTYDGFPNKISYTVSNKESYSLIQNSILPSGFKLTNSEIEDNKVTSTYENVLYSLKIETEQRKDNDWIDRSITAYNITLIKKAGIYDEENGEKTDYYYGDIKKAEYNLSNGKINGQIKLYYENGNLKKTGNFTNGVSNGKFIEYDEKGNKTSEYTTLNGEIEGIQTIYEKNISQITNFKKGIKNGQYLMYNYDDETGNLKLKLIGQYLNDKKNGTWQLFYIEEEKESLLTIENYINGIKDGAFQDIKGDSLIIGSYENNEIHGRYKVYRDFAKMLFGGIIRTDTSKINLISDGYYDKGLRSGYWRNYDFTKTLINEGSFLDDKETGEWKYYYTKFSDGKTGNMPCSGQLYLSQSLSNGKLNGKSTRYSYLSKKEYLSPSLNENQNSIDSCTIFLCKKVLETSFYINGKLNGSYEFLDSLNNVIAKGNYKNDLKDGEWIERDDNFGFTFRKGDYLNDKPEGNWILYYRGGRVAQSFNYKDGKLHGEYIKYNLHDSPEEKKVFELGDFKELIKYDSLGIRPIIKYEIFDVADTCYKCRKTDYNNNGYISQMYFLIKKGNIDHIIFEAIFDMLVNQSGGKYGYDDGEFTIYENGRPMVIGAMFKGEKVGAWSTYLYNENIKIERNYVQDKITGEIFTTLDGKYYSGDFVLENNENGKKEICKIKNGLRNGKTTYIDNKTGKILKKETYKNGILK